MGIRFPDRFPWHLGILKCYQSLVKTKLSSPSRQKVAVQLVIHLRRKHQTRSKENQKDVIHVQYHAQKHQRTHRSATNEKTQSKNLNIFRKRAPPNMFSRTLGGLSANVTGQGPTKHGCADSHPHLDIRKFGFEKPRISRGVPLKAQRNLASFP